MTVIDSCFSSANPTQTQSVSDSDSCSLRLRLSQTQSQPETQAQPRSAQPQPRARPRPGQGQPRARAGAGFMKPLRLTRLDFLTNECTLLGTCVEFGPTQLPVNSFILGLGLGLGLAGLWLGLGPTGSWVGPNPTQVPFVACQGQSQASITHQISHRHRKSQVQRPRVKTSSSNRNSLCL